MIMKMSTNSSYKLGNMFSVKKLKTTVLVSEVASQRYFLPPQTLQVVDLMIRTQSNIIPSKCHQSWRKNASSFPSSSVDVDVYCVSSLGQVFSEVCGKLMNKKEN